MCNNNEVGLSKCWIRIDIIRCECGKDECKNGIYDCYPCCRGLEFGCILAFSGVLRHQKHIDCHYNNCKDADEYAQFTCSTSCCSCVCHSIASFDKYTLLLAYCDFAGADDVGRFCFILSTTSCLTSFSTDLESDVVGPETEKIV